jgi:hypothetical protein
MIGRRVVASGRSERARAAGVTLALLLVANGACTTNHDALAKQPKAGSAGGGSGGGSGAATGGFGNTAAVPSQGGRPNPDFEAAGDDVLTIVNGVIDAPSVELCFARLADNGESGELVGAPLPALSYAASTVLTEVEGFSFADDAIVPWVLAGELSLVDGLDCHDAVALAVSEEAKVTPPEPNAGSGGEAGVAGVGGAGGEPAIPLELPTLRARPLAAIPAGTVNIGRSILMVLTGCMGGAAFEDSVDTSACGDAYTPSTPTLQPLVVKLSRTPGFDKVGLQAVQAAPAVDGTVDVRASGESGVVSLTFASSVSFGAIEPRPADVRFSPDELGVSRNDFGLQAVGDSGVLFQEAWPDIREASGLGEIEAHRNYTAVLLGPDPLLLKQGWWNGSAFSLVENDPTRE